MTATIKTGKAKPYLQRGKRLSNGQHCGRYVRVYFSDRDIEGINELAELDPNFATHEPDIVLSTEAVMSVRDKLRRLKESFHAHNFLPSFNGRLPLYCSLSIAA
jgi:hypothetical protein